MKEVGDRCMAEGRRVELNSTAKSRSNVKGGDRDTAEKLQSQGWS